MAEIPENPQAPESPGGESQPGQNVSTEQPEISKDARMWAMFCHLAGLAGCVIPVVGNIVGPLVLWQIKKEDSPFVDEHGKEAVNFQISMSLYALISVPLFFICVGPFLLAAVGLMDLVFLLIAAVRANNGQHYRYPLTIRFIK